MPGLFLATYRKQDPAGPPFALTSANNVLSVDPVSGAIVLGNDVGGTSATLLSNREIPFGGFFLKQISGAAATSLTNLIFGDAPGFQVVENNALNSTAPLTEVGYRIRTNPKAAGPFSIPLQFDTKLSNQGTLTFLLRDLSAVPVGVTNFVFRLQDAGGSGNPLTISNNQFVTVSQMLGVAASGPLNNARVSVLNDGNAANVAMSVKNGDNGVNSSIDILFTNDVNTATLRLNGSTHAINPNVFFVDNTTLASDILLNTGTASMPAIPAWKTSETSTTMPCSGKRLRLRSDSSLSPSRSRLCSDCCSRCWLRASCGFWG